jgi:hypothetical protein
MPSAPFGLEISVGAGIGSNTLDDCAKFFWRMDIQWVDDWVDGGHIGLLDSIFINSYSHVNIP